MLVVERLSEVIAKEIELNTKQFASSYMILFYDEKVEASNKK